MKLILLVWGLLAAVSSPVFAQSSKKSDPTEVLVRTSNWEVNYDKDLCHLFAAFGDPEGQLVLRLSWFGSAGYTVTLYGERLKRSGVRAKSIVDFGFGPVEKEVAFGTADNRPVALFAMTGFTEWTSQPPTYERPEIPPEMAAKVTGLRVSIPGGAPFRLQFGSLEKPVKAIQSCLSTVVSNWGYDPVVQATLSKRALPATSPGTWVRNSDYPESAIIRGQSGLLQFRLDVSETGSVLGCHIIGRTNPDVFGDTMCKILSQRAKFTPALDAQGKPVRSFYTNSFRFEVG